MMRHRSTLLWTALVFVAVLLRVLASEAGIEHVYSRTIFPALRLGIDWLFGWLPFAWVYVGVAVLAFFGVRNLVRSLRTRKPLGERMLTWARRTWTLLCAAVFLFLLLWGFNYGRVPLEAQLGINPAAMLVDDLEAELRTVTRELTQLRARLPGVTDSAYVRLPADRSELADFLRPQLERTLRKHGYPTAGRVRVRQLRPRGILLRISTAGVYLPWTGEGHVDAGLHELQLPFVLLHEMSHGYGIADEGSCNFMAYLAGTDSDDAILQYVATFSYWRYLASNYRRYRSEAYRDFYETDVPLGVKSDLRAVYAEMEKYPDILPEFRDLAYDSYLKVQGIDEGLKNYSRIIMLATAYRKSRGLAPHLQNIDGAKE